MSAELWDAARREWQTVLERQGLTESTRRRLNKHLLKFSREVGKPPFDVTAADVETWLGSMNVTANALYVYRAGLRNFYRWATRAGRIEIDPTEAAKHPLALDVPRDWEDALRDYDRWLKAKGLAPTSRCTYRERLELLSRQSGASSPWTLSERDLTRWLSGHNWSRETLRRTRNALKGFYEWAELNGYVECSPAQELPAVRGAHHLPRPASEDAYTAALHRADERTRLILRLAAELGLRRVEVAGLHSNDLMEDSERRWWLHVRGKGDKVRAVPLPNDLARELRDRGAGWIFPSPASGHLTPRHVGKLVVSCLDGATMHQLRHRFATQAYRSTRNLFAVQQLLGHVNPSTTQRYVATTDDELRDAVDAVAKVRWAS